MSNQDPYQQPGAAGWQPGPYTAPAPQPAYPAAPQAAYPQAQGHPSFAPYGAAAPQDGYPAAAPQYGYPAAPQYGAPQYGAPAYGYTPAPFGVAPTYAHWGLRVGAFLLDLLSLIPYWTGSAINSATSTSGYDLSGNVTSQMSSTGLAALVIGIAISLGLWVWNRGFRQARTGQSWGKKVVGLQLVLESTGEHVGVWRALLRDLAHWFDCWVLGLGFWFPLWDAKRQTFADKLAKTVSVK
ncbi:RDD family protein [Cellulomonas sp. P5_C6]